jgi:AcrR family transcriptional regulator
VESPPEYVQSAPKRTVRTPQQARSRRTRLRVLEAAVDCFETSGYDETTTAMIAQRAGVAVGSVYGYFKDKREILLELLQTTVREEADQVIQDLAPAAWQGEDPRVWTRSLIDTVFHSQRIRPGLQRVMWERYFKDPGFRGPFEAIRESLRVAIDGFIAAVEAEGLCRELTDREIAPTVILHAVQWNANQAFLRGDPDGIDRAARATAEMISRYLFVED